MKVFICAFGGFYVAIPMSSVASLTDLKGGQTVVGDVVTRRDTESGETYVSLPLLFNLPQEKLRHGIVLKSPDDSNDGPDAGGKIVLLSTEVVNTSDIPEEKIHPVPRALSRTRFSEIFCGMQCDAESTRDAGLVILMNPELLVRYARQDATE